MSDEEETDEKYEPGFESDSEDDAELLSNRTKLSVMSVKKLL